MRCLSYLLVALLAFIYSAAAQTATASSSPAYHTVVVGYNSNQFSPNNLTANPGDVVVFQFIAQGHTVVQSNFEEPCVPRDAYHPGRSVFFSGWYNGSDKPTWNLTINDTAPIFYYCSRWNSCLKEHMIGSINQNATYSLQAQLNSINSSDIMLQPGEAIPEEGGTPSSSATPTPHHSVTLSGGAIAGIAVAGVVVLALACALFWFVGRHRTLKDSLKSSSQHSGAVESWVNSTNPPSTVGGPSSMRPPSYGPGDGGYMTPMDAHKHWDYSQPRHSYMPMTPPIQELGVSEPVEMEETGRGRTRERESE
ncbi:uncharacterized protein M437DRAFT_55190 [Aureobasidium melanogenum CBS 110374]|uniref:Cupredoxin n=1 Tax=Aureobasidium melanogenum (strain CBS 110374) TaxID=1043003 RepID=A0A074VM40_AURM1|nr:uncharacterized protein M437DRAFT_55190 [Aureobasidium melanogenum CBS 110374]KEQ60164.1 hypothetical protein M437DRAFT_55190 [Aureobasidium melanogenum CBS 110374]